MFLKTAALKLSKTKINLNVLISKIPVNIFFNFIHLHITYQFSILIIYHVNILTSHKTATPYTNILK